MATRRPGNGQVNGDSLKDFEEDGGPVQSHHMVSDDMLYKLSKKIAQLTKVIYSLNTKNDDLEFDMENMRHGYEDKLEKVSVDQQKVYLLVLRICLITYYSKGKLNGQTDYGRKRKKLFID